jgi:hypothetical protein
MTCNYLIRPPRYGYCRLPRCGPAMLHAPAGNESDLRVYNPDVCEPVMVSPGSDLLIANPGEWGLRAGDGDVAELQMLGPVLR